MVNVSGTVLYTNKLYVQKKLGEEALQRILERVEKKTRDTISRPIQSGQMYNLEIFLDFLDVMVEEYGWETLADSAYFAAHRQFKGLFGLVLKVVRPQKIMSQANQMWRKSYDSGQLTVEEFSDSAVRLRVTDFAFTDALRKGEEYFLKEMIRLILKKKIIRSESRSEGYMNTLFVFELGEKE